MLTSDGAKCCIFKLAVCVRKNSNRFRPKFVEQVELRASLGLAANYFHITYAIKRYFALAKYGYSEAQPSETD